MHTFEAEEPRDHGQFPSKCVSAEGIYDEHRADLPPFVLETLVHEPKNDIASII